MGSAAFMDTIKELQAYMTKVDEVRQGNRDATQKDKLTFIADGVSAMGWVTFEGKPADIVAELFGGAQMAGNKVKKQFKET